LTFESVRPSSAVGRGNVARTMDTTIRIDTFDTES
jgi:hypothetical protein